MLTISLLLLAALEPTVQDSADGAPDLNAAVERGVEILLSMQESLAGDETAAEWPYEGVYRERGEIPPGYRVGGTSIAAWALIESPGYDDSRERRAAVERATRFVLDTLGQEAMSAGFSGGYDVRGWGHTYALQFFLQLRAKKLVPEALTPEIDARITWLVRVLQETEIAETGGWNYGRRGADTPSPASGFMTAPTLIALFEARHQGEEVDAKVVERALNTLERGRAEGGWYTYTSAGGFDTLAGAIGRNSAAEVALLLAGRRDADDVRQSLDWFLEHWDELEKRRRQNGTHEGTHRIAPYYFFYAHYYAALAIEFLPEEERPEYRAYYLELLFDVREDSGGWNDRVFPRSENYGTAMSMLAILCPRMGRPAPWSEQASTRTR